MIEQAKYTTTVNVLVIIKIILEKEKRPKSPLVTGSGSLLEAVCGLPLFLSLVQEQERDGTGEKEKGEQKTEKTRPSSCVRCRSEHKSRLCH